MFIRGSTCERKEETEVGKGRNQPEIQADRASANGVECAEEQPFIPHVAVKWTDFSDLSSLSHLRRKVMTLSNGAL